MNLLDLIYIPLGLLTAPLWMRKKRDGWDERFGHVEGMLHEKTILSQRGRVMLHAVSVGEVNALRSLVPMLNEHADVIVSTTTDTGLKQAQSLFGEMERVEVVRYPIDCSWMVRRFLDAVKPDVVGLVELEVWPNFVKGCVTRGIPVGIINGRLSERSFKGYRKIRMLLRPTFRRLSFVCVQDQSYGERIKQMGVDRDRVSITGSMKWDSVDASVHAEPSTRALEIGSVMGIDLAQPIVVAGSTGPGEEGLIHQAVPADVQLVIAPRKPERFDEAAQAVPGCVRRSKGERGEGTTRFLLDTIGELSAMYELADLVIIGRSFFDLYGSDPIEPAALGKAVVIGPAHSDFQEPMRVLQEGDAIQVVDSQGLGGVVADLLSDDRAGKEMGERARVCVGRQQGATRRHVEALMGQIQTKNG